ncbi:DUF378 domain-containing protein [Virgibacillus sediminis]|uniref:DUF378 domain-containing protein n=1 Tax=Virgibacillus sediminis TaxID=202260 RepID=A0ABV7A7Q9_9BACI
MKVLDRVSLTILILGGLNWMLIGLFEWDLVGGLLGGMDSPFAKVIYVIVGIAAIYSLKMLGSLNDQVR